MSDSKDRLVVRLEAYGDIAVIKIDNPPINAGSTAVRKGLLAAVEEFSANAGFTGAVLIGEGRWFMAGSDMREINSLVLDPPLPTVINAIEQCPKPVVAAIAGGALGGGYELSLGCDARLASPEAVIGLPECLLGMMPGAGGTQRLPRLAGLPISIGLICTGARVAAAQAARIGMIDQVVEGDLLQAAMTHLRSMGGRKRRVMDIPVPVCTPAELARAKADALAAAGDRPHIRHAIEAVEACLTSPGDEALRVEREVFNRLRTGREVAARLHLFFAERNSAKIPALKEVKARPVQSVAIVGTAPVGGQLAGALRDAGMPVVLIGEDELVSEEDLAQADIVFEVTCGGEDSRRDHVARLANLVKPGVVVVVCNPVHSAPVKDGVVALHLVATGQRLAMAEMAMPPQSDRVALVTVAALLKALKIVTIAVGETEVPVGKRLLDACQRACARLIEFTIPASEIKEALRSFGFAVDVPAAHGFQFGDNSQDERALSRPKIIEFCLVAMTAEAALLVADGTVSDPTHIDLILAEGYGFPRHEGGVVFWARQQPRSELDEAMRCLHDMSGENFRIGPLDSLWAKAVIA